MKTKNALVVGLTTAMILSLGITSTYAYGGNGQGGGQGKGMRFTQEQRDEIQSMTMEERKKYMRENGIEMGKGKGGKGHGKKGGEKSCDHSPSTMLEDIPLSDVSDIEIELLTDLYSEEMLARDVYNHFYELYGEEVFKNISSSEQKHMDALAALINRYELDTPTGYGEFQELYDSLIAEGEKGLIEALSVGLKVEKLDIEDIADAIKNTDNDDFKVIFTNIGGASYNHLRGFVKAIDTNNLETNVDYSDYLSENELDTKGPLKYKLAEKLEDEGVELPEQVSSDTLKEKGGKGHGENDDMKESKGKSKYSNRNNSNANENKYSNNSITKAKDKVSYETKYGTIIEKMDDVKLNTFIDKIDVIIEKVENGNYSDATKVKYNTMLNALKEIAVENLDVDDNLFNGLFE